ncbi:MAG: hypothetical protein ACR2KK_00520 [Acidimicrobiales bacterium]
MRVLSVVTALALVFAVFALTQHRAEATPSNVTASIAGASAVSGGDAAQIHFGQIFCHTLLAIANAFKHSPFFAFVQAAIQPLLHHFHCVPSG